MGKSGMNKNYTEALWKNILYFIIMIPIIIGCSFIPNINMGEDIGKYFMFVY